jgi:UDP-glucose 4-epimerase
VDIRQRERMAALLRGIDVVFHLACLGAPLIHSPDENHEVNASATLALLSLAKAAAVKRFVYVSSPKFTVPPAGASLTEEHPAFPRFVYGAAKLA